MSEQSEGNNHANEINVSIFFLLGAQKMDFFASHAAIKSTLWPASRKNGFICPAGEKNALFVPLVEKVVLGTNLRNIFSIVK